jgi:hypothetical protein
MKALKTFFAAALVVAFGTFAIGMQAQSSSSTSTSGGASSGANINSGTDQTGGFSNGGSNGLYNANDKDFSAGAADSTTKAKSTFNVGDGSASSFSKGMTGSDSFALGALKGTNTTINGSTSQGNWAGLSTDSMNGVSAGNATSGQYQATGKDTSELTGTVHDIGDTKVTAVEGPTSASSTLKTFGASDADVSGFQEPGIQAECTSKSSAPQSSVSVTGNGSAGGQSYLADNNNNYAGATNNATMSYNATGKTNASGALGAVGSTSATLTPTTATSSSNMKSFSAANGH